MKSSNEKVVVPSLDLVQVRRAFNRAATTYDSAAVFQREVAARMVERLQWVSLKVKRILDLGAGTAHMAPLLLARYPEAEYIALDCAADLLLQGRCVRGTEKITWLCADMAELPLADGSVDLIVSNQSLHWREDLVSTLSAWRRVLRPEGLLMYTTLGTDTFQELRASWATVDNAAHVHEFFDMQDLGNAMTQAQLADPVMDTEMITVKYKALKNFLRALKNLGVQNAGFTRQRGLTSVARFKQFQTAYDTHRDEQGLLPVSYEVIYGHAWAPDLSGRVDAHSGEVRVPIAAVGRTELLHRKK